MNKEIKLESEYPNLASVADSGLIHLPAESKIDLGMNILIIVQDQIDFRLDIKDQILENLIRYLQQLLTSGVDPIITARGLCMFRAYSQLILNGDSQQQLVQACHAMFVNCLKELMNILIVKDGGGSREALVLIASDCFEKIMINHFKDKVLSPYIGEMLEILI